MKKRVASLALALAMMTGGASAGAQALDNSAPSIDLEIIETQQAYVYDRETGAWSLTPNRARAALDAVSEGFGRGSSSAGTMLLYVTLEGSAPENTLLPMLNLCYIGSADVGAGAASLLIDGIRYDFEVAGEVSAIGPYRAEIMRAPLDAGGMDMLNALIAEDEFGVMLHGTRRAYEYEVELESDGDYSSERMELQAASVDCVREALAIYQALGAGADSQRLIGAWEKANDKRCAYVPCVIAEQPRVSLRLDRDFDVLKMGDSSSYVRKLQELLCEAGYMYVDPTTRFSDQTRAAVLRAQLAMGMVPTGSADAALISALESDATEAAQPAPAREDEGAKRVTGEVAAEPGVTYEIEGAARVRVDSFRFAESALPLSGDGTAAISASDADNVLILFEGELRSLAPASVDAAWEYTAQATLDGKYSYECTLTVEQDGGESFGSALLPLGGGRMLAYAEVPAYAAESGGEWTLTIKFGETTLTYTAK